MRITFDVPDDGRDYLEWIEVEEIEMDGARIFYVLDTNKDDAADRVWQNAVVKIIGPGPSDAGDRVAFRFPRLMPAGRWDILGLGEPGFPDGFTVKSID